MGINLNCATAKVMAVIVATTAPVVPALAQSDIELEEIVVTGFRRSLEDSIEVKRSADTFVEVISAEDIGKLPDISIAESLARLPGITSQRTNGQSSAINIRGLSQSLTLSTLNGREQVTPNGNRSVEFEQFPSELIGGAEVYKTPKASLIEGGLAGTVELKTIKPLSRDGASFNANLRGSYNDRASEIFDADSAGYRLSASYVDQFANNTVGILLGYARLEQPDVSTRFVGFDYQSGSVDFNGDGTPDAIPFGFEAEEQGGTDTRDGIILGLQLKPNDALSIELDGYYSKFESESFGRGVRVIGPQAATFGGTTINNPVVSNNAIIGGQFNRSTGAPTNGGGFGLTALGINDNQADEDELFTFGGNVEYVSGPWTFSADYTYSKAESFFSNEVSGILPYASFSGGDNGTGILEDNLSIGYFSNGTNLPNLSFSEDFSDRSNLAFSRFGAFPNQNEDELNAIRGDIEFEMENHSFISSVEAGLRYSDREAVQVVTSADFGNDAGFFQFAAGGIPLLIPLNDSNSSIECFSGEFADNGFPCFPVVADPRALAETVTGPITPNQDQGFTLTQSYTLTEKTTAAYLMANIETEWGSVPVSGNVGVRVVDTEQSSVSAAVPELAAGIDYTEWLPSLNLVFKLSETDQIRFGISRALARPPFTQLGAGFNVTVNSTEGRLTGGGQGNPTLEPFISDNIDLAYERYFESGGIFTAGVFYKDLDTFIVTENNDAFDFSPLLQFASEQDRALLAGLGISNIGSFTGPVNGSGGNVRGLELGYTHTWELATGAIGFTGNYSYTDSEISFNAANSGVELTLPLPGLSEDVVNATLFYQHNSGFETRAGVRYRSEFISPQTGLNSQLPFTDDELVVDLQASYEFGVDGPMAGWKLLAQANNITDEPVATFFGTPSQTGTIQHFGRQFFLGVSYSWNEN